MTFLQLSSGLGKKILLAAFIIFSCLSLNAYAQRPTPTATPQPQQQGKRYGDPGFRGEPINLNVVNADIRDILNYITEQYGVNFVIDKSVGQVPVTVNVSDVPWNIALDSILQSQDLGVQVNGPILRIAQRKTLAEEAAVESQIRNSQLDNSPLYTEFIRLNYARASGTITPASFSTGTPSGGSVDSAGGGGGGEGLLPIIKRRLSRRGSIETDSRSNTLIITDVRENIDAIRQLVLLLDQPEPQVEIEARVVIASRNFSRDIGVQLSAIVLGNRIGDGGGAQGGTLPGVNNQVGPRPGVLGNQPSNQLQSAISNTVIGLTTGVFGTAQISALISAGEQKGQAKTIATPRVTTLNNRQATIESGQQIPIVTTQTGTNGGGVVFTTQYISVPLKLEVTPQITDAGTVLLNISVENSSLSSTSSAGGSPGISTQRMKNEVMVPDGGTTVVGGALIDVEGEDQFRTPGLSKVPILGNLFKRKAIARTTNEILFFITPRIYRPDYEGNPTAGKVGTGNRTTTILQPVPLGNPPSNSDPATQQPAVVPVAPVVVNPTPQPTQPTPNQRP